VLVLIVTIIYRLHDHHQYHHYFLSESLSSSSSSPSSERLIFMFHISEGPGSNLDSDNRYRDYSCLWFSSGNTRIAPKIRP